MVNSSQFINDNQHFIIDWHVIRNHCQGQFSGNVMFSMHCSIYMKHIAAELKGIPYRRKIWRGFKFDGLAVSRITAKFKSANFICSFYTSYTNRIKLIA